MTILITLVLPPGGDAGPFNLYSNLDGYVAPFATNISAAALLAGYTATNVPDGTTTIRVKSVGVCTNFVNVAVNVLPTTTTTSSTSTTTSTSTTAAPTTTTTSSSSTSTSTSTTTSTSSSTTTTTTTIACECVLYTIVTSQEALTAADDNLLHIEYVNCAGDSSEKTVGIAGTGTLCTTNAVGINPLLYILIGGIPSSAIGCSATKTSICCSSPGPNNLTVNNQSSTINVISVSVPSPCSIALPTDIGPETIISGDISNCNGDITVNVEFVAIGDHCVSLIINDVIVDEQSFTVDGSYVLTNPGILTTDAVVIVVRDGECLSAREGIISELSSPSDACPIPMTLPCWISGTGVLGVGDFIYVDPGMTIPFVGNSIPGNEQYYHVQLLAYTLTLSVPVISTGEIVSGVDSLVCDL